MKGTYTLLISSKNNENREVCQLLMECNIPHETFSSSDADDGPVLHFPAPSTLKYRGLEEIRNYLKGKRS